MNDKRYTPKQAAALMRRVLKLPTMSVGPARKVLLDLLSARLSDVAVNSPEKVVKAIPDPMLSGFQESLLFYVSLLTLSTGSPTGSGQVPDVVLPSVSLSLSGRDGIRVEVSGEPGSLFPIQLYGLVRLLDGRVRRCECGQLFLRTRRQTSCSPQHAKRFYMRRFRAGDAGGGRSSYGKTRTK